MELLVEGGEERYNADLRQQNLRGQTVASVEELFQAAPAALKKYQRIVQQVAAEAGIDTKRVKVAPLKDPVRAVEKARDYGKREPGPDVSWLFDIVRGKVECESEGEILGLVAGLLNLSIGSSDEVKIVRLKNRFKKSTPAGYRDINMNIMIKVDGDREGGEEEEEQQFCFFHVCELQVHFKQIVERDRELGSHVAYEFFRSYFKGSTSSVERRLKMMDEIFKMDESAGSCEIKDIVDQCAAEMVEIFSDEGAKQRLLALLDLLELMNEYQHQALLLRVQLDYTELLLGPEDINVLDLINNLAILFKDLGEHAEARALYNRALAGKEKLLGVDHVQTLHLVNNQANLLESLGEYAEARDLYDRALAGYEKQLGVDHVTTLDTVNNLANLLESLGEYGEAREMYNRALAGYEKQLGVDHVRTLTSVNNLAVLLRDLGEYAAAREMYNRALAGREKQLGVDHVHTLSTVNNLAGLLESLGEYAEARDLYDRALAGQERQLGVDHVSTLLTVFNLRLLLIELNDREEALVLLSRAAAGFQEKLGADHPYTKAAVTQLEELQTRECSCCSCM